MLRCLADENFNNDLIRALRLRSSDVDIVRVQDTRLAGTSDHEVLEWAAENGRVVLTHDRATFPHRAFRRVAAGLPMAGVFVVGSKLSSRHVVEDLLLIAACSDTSEWAGRVLHLPL